MYKLLKSNKKTLIISTVTIVILILIDQTSKFYIYNFHRSIIDTCEGSDAFVHFHPTFNTAGSALGLKFGFEHSKTMFFIITLLGVLCAFLLWVYLLHCKDIYNGSGFIVVPAVFLFSGTLGRLVERIIWEFTLDFIAINRIGVLDLIDTYLWFGLLSLFPVWFLLQRAENNLTKGLAKADIKKLKAEQRINFLRLFIKGN